MRALARERPNPLTAIWRAAAPGVSHAQPCRPSGDVAVVDDTRMAAHEIREAAFALPVRRGETTEARAGREAVRRARHGGTRSPRAGPLGGG